MLVMGMIRESRQDLSKKVGMMSKGAGGIGRSKDGSFHFVMTCRREACEARRYKRRINMRRGVLTGLKGRAKLSDFLIKEF